MSTNTSGTCGTTSGGSQATTTAPTAIPTNTAGLDEAFLKSISDYVPVPENGNSVQPRERGDFELEPVEDDGSIQSIASNGIYTNPVGDGDGEQSGMLRDVLNLRPDTNSMSDYSTNDSSYEETDAESLEQSNTLALAEKSGAEQWNTMGMTAMPGAKMDEDPDSQNPAKRWKLSKKEEEVQAELAQSSEEVSQAQVAVSFGATLSSKGWTETASTGREPFSFA
ncbi:hypothetical protein THAOC_22802 [Thalassiosira oceanica]|uniref:Uncharacterized protein n=1 Tax=Thalassiosira oceanica TaxID=159749 RepID=K0RTP2_THAOC|nr:hypothetical protein THAOC_22802 [Thalassiosira oceanica]|eukprot:EJK57183.1 hypothetical protein THAOC_22802 [Thalassiosira oceanica]